MSFSWDFGVGNSFQPSYAGLPNQSLIKSTSNTGPVNATPGTSGGSVMNVITSLSDIARGWYGAVSAADVANEQVKAGQYPTAIGTNGTLSGTANISGVSALSSGLGSGLPSWLLLAVLAVVLLLVLRK